MKNKIIFTNILAGLIAALFIVSCKEDKPKGDEFGWSPDGKKLAMVNIESKELVLVELDGEKIGQVTLIDSISGEKAKIFLPCWSRDGRYLLYARSSKIALEILVYAIKENKLTRIDYIPIDEKKGFEGKVFVSWSPVMNRILWLSWNNMAEPRLFSALPDGNDRKLVTKLVGEKVLPFPAWSPDGEWIAYSVYMQGGHKNNGLWKLKSDGRANQQIFPAKEITAFQWQPDGSHFAMVTKAVFQTTQGQGTSTEIKYHFKLSLIDSNGKNERILSEEEKPILELAWSPDGKQLAFFQQQDNSSDVWVVNLDSNRKVKLNFNKVQDFLGWGSSHQLFYTTDYPEELGTETKEQKDARELFETLRGVLKENLLVKSAQFKQRNLRNNISAFAGGGQNGAVAYYRSSRLDISGDEAYYPVIEFADGERLYPARTKEQYVSAADECYLNGRYQTALDHFSNYCDTDLNATEFSTKFDADTIINQIELMYDSTSNKMSLEQLGECFLDEGDLLRMVLILRKLGETEKAGWLFEQFKKLTFYLIKKQKNEKGKTEVIDNLFYTIMGIYSRYNELASGISDLDQFLQSDNLDSNLITFTNYTQAILAFEGRQYELGLKKMGPAISYLPQKKAELDDIIGLLMLCVSNLTGKKQMMVVPLLRQILERFPDDKNVYQIYDMLGDVYLNQNQQEEALEAYQTAVTQHFDQHKIWDKILGVR